MSLINYVIMWTVIENELFMNIKFFILFRHTCIYIYMFSLMYVRHIEPAEYGPKKINYYLLLLLLVLSRMSWLTKINIR